MSTSLVLINNIYHRQLILRTIFMIVYTSFMISVIFFLLSLTSRFLYLLFLNYVVVLVAYEIAVAPIVWVSRSYLDIYRNYEILLFLFRNKFILKSYS